MGEVDVAGFRRALRGAARVGVDTVVWIYHLADVRPYSELTLHLLSAAAAGPLKLVLSTVSVAEILTGPWRAGKGDRAERIEAALQALPGIATADITWSIARSAARIRGETDLPLPDALIIASALDSGARLLVTNDAGWAHARHLGSRILMLDDYVNV